MLCIFVEFYMQLSCFPFLCLIMFASLHYCLDLCRSRTAAMSYLSSCFPLALKQCKLVRTHVCCNANNHWFSDLQELGTKQTIIIRYTKTENVIKFVRLDLRSIEWKLGQSNNIRLRLTHVLFRGKNNTGWSSFLEEPFKLGLGTETTGPWISDSLKVASP